MIYEFIDNLVCRFRKIWHFFRALFCKAYYTDDNKNRRCSSAKISYLGIDGFCEWWDCPKRKKVKE